MPILVLQPVDQATEVALAQQLACWAKTGRGLTDPLVRYTGCCASPTAETVGRWMVDTAVCAEYGPPPFTGNNGEPIDCGAGAPFTTYLIYPVDVGPIDPNRCASPGPPGPIVLGWEPDLAVMTAVSVMAAGPDDMAVMIDFGDGNRVSTTTGQALVHDYTMPGSWTVTAWPVQDPQLSTSAGVVVKDHAPVIHVYSDPDDDWRSLLWVDEPGDATVYAIDWGDGSADQMIQRDPPPYPRVPHDYTAAGTYTATVTDTATRRVSRVAYECGQMGVLFSFPTDDSIPQVVVTRMRVGADWELDWGDGAPVETGTVPPTARLDRLRESAMGPGTYTVTAREVVDGQVRRLAVRELVIPSVFNLALNVGMNWSRAASTRTVEVTPYNASVTCNVNWGDGSAVEQVEPGQPITHVYDSAPPTEGWMLHVVEASGANPKHFSRLIGEPTFVAEPNLSAWRRWSVDLHVAGIQGVTNADWYRITWGDGNTNDIGAVGAWWNTWHAYASPGTYTITVDAPGMAEAITRTIIVPDYPVPVITAAEDTSDLTHMTTLVTVDNTACGGPVTLRFGDGALVPGPESGAVPHAFAAAGQYTVICSCDADATARDRTSVTVPYQQPVTLQAVIGRDPAGNEYTARVEIIAHTSGRQIEVDWSDGNSWQLITALPYDSNEYLLPDSYTVRVRYAGDDTEIVALPIEIPFA